MDLYLSPIVAPWRCKERGLCCKHHRVTLSEIERRRIGRHLLEMADPRALALAPERLEREGDGFVLPRQRDAAGDDACLFLDPDSRCGLRKRFGERAYPDVCRKFPYLGIHTGERLVVDLTLHCPTALELFARCERFAQTIEPDGEPPVDRFAILGDDEHAYFGLDGAPLSPTAFWERHWQLCAALSARPEREPAALLMAFVEALGAAPPTPARLTRAQLAYGVFDPAVGAELERVAGGVPDNLMVLWVDLPRHAYDLDLGDRALDPDALMVRYLLHRAHCPTFYLVARDHRWLVTALFVLLARFRIEIAQGADPLDAVRQVDRFLIHGPNVGAFHESESTAAPWRAMAALACAEVVDAT